MSAVVSGMDDIAIDRLDRQAAHHSGPAGTRGWSNAPSGSVTEVKRTARPRDAGVSLPDGLGVDRAPG